MNIMLSRRNYPNSVPHASPHNTLDLHVQKCTLRTTNGTCHRKPSARAMVIVSLLLAIAMQVEFASAAIIVPPMAEPQSAPLPQPSEDIACADTPFGRQLTLGKDAEFVDVLDFNVTLPPNQFHEWTLPPDPDDPSAPAYDLHISTDWAVGPFSDGALLGATHADLNGDGQDELIVAANVYSPTAHVVVGVLRRGRYGNVLLMDTWSGSNLFNSLNIISANIIAGDFDGSKDGKDELALMVRGSDNSLRIVVLSGNDDGTIAQADDEFAGFWHWAPQAGDSVGQIAITSGALVLDGRNQILVISEYKPGNNRVIKYHLLEYQPRPAFNTLTGDVSMGTLYFSSDMGSNFRYGSHGDESSTIIGNIKRISADTGDVVGDATDELISHYEFQNIDGQYELHQRLQHFDTVRDSAGDIFEILLSRPDGVPFDDGIKIHSGDSAGWDSVVHNIDEQPKAEIIEVFNRYTPPSSFLEAEVYKVAYDLTASFTYYRSDLDVQFTENSVGYNAGPFDNPLSGWRWDFGDGGTSNQVNPVHSYANAGDYTVTLRIAELVGSGVDQSTYQREIHVEGGSDAHGEGLSSNDYRYRIRHDPVYASEHTITHDNSTPLTEIHADAADMDRDGVSEIMALSIQGTSGPDSGLLRSRWRLHLNPLPPNDFTGWHMLEPDSGTLPLSNLDGLAAFAADLDGDSVEATIGPDCRRVHEAQARELVWAPPYFERLQAGALRAAAFGRSTTEGSDLERQFGTFTSHDVSGYIGGGLGFDLFGLIGVQAQITATAGRYEQTANGSVVGTENDFDLTQGWEQQDKDGLLVIENNTFDCYTYDVRQAAVGIDPDSSVRMCEIQKEDTHMSGTNPDYWDREFPLVWAAGSEGQPPPNWAPLTRDWANLALFKPVRTNATFVAGSEVGKLTDGRFTTTGESQQMLQPYVEIDLGSVQPITDIRIFAPYGELASDLTGFRVYTSTAPMPATGLPTGGDVHEFAPDSLSSVVYDRWNIWTRTWNNSQPGSTPGDPLRVRYIRLQHPDQARIRVGQLQVFGDTHNEPQRYPDAVCDPTSDDGFFLAKVWDASASAFRAIEVRGDMLWAGTKPTNGWGADGPYLQNCINNVLITAKDNHSYFNIGFNADVGPSADQSWSFSQSNINRIGTTTSFQNSTRVGAEFDLSATAFVTMVGGGADEFTNGVTEEDQTVNYWGEGVDVGGGIGGFQPPYDTAQYIGACHYSAQPYAYKLDERSNTGYLHSIYTVDYVVPEESSSTAWTRADMPQQCLPLPSDRIFASGFEAQ